MTVLIGLNLCCINMGCIHRSGAPEPIAKHPDAPMMIDAAEDGRLRVYVYEKETNMLVLYGWIEADERLHGWTLSKFDWSEYMARGGGP